MGAKSSKEPLQLAEYVDLNKYVGMWYVISRIGTPLETGHCNSTDEYIMKPNGKIHVIYKANKKHIDGPPTSYTQTLWSASTNNAYMKIQPIWPLAFDYVVLDVDPEYNWTLVGTPKRNMLWIMARTSSIDSKLYEDLVERCKQRGFDVSKLEVVKHKQ